MQKHSLPFSWHPDVMMGGVALSALLIRGHLESGVQPPRVRSEQRLMKSVWRAECWKELQWRMSLWASLCPPVCPSTVSLHLDLPLRVLKRVTVWHYLSPLKHSFLSLSYWWHFMRMVQVNTSKKIIWYQWQKIKGIITRHNIVNKLSNGL